jgi:ssDNA-binding Zn-finger/Zn-ribbon topoisomerase 1
MVVPSTCPECGALLKHVKESPGGTNDPMTMTCPECNFEDTT